MGMTRY